MLGTDLAAACAERGHTVQVYDLPALDITNPAHIRTAAEGADVIADKAVAIATEPRAGPVHIDVPISVADQTVVPQLKRRRPPASPVVPAPGHDLDRARLWLEDAIFQAYDKDWVRKLGGYLGHKGHVPAGRFNAGQKMFYWFTAAFGIIMSVTGVGAAVNTAGVEPGAAVVALQVVQAAVQMHQFGGAGRGEPGAEVGEGVVNTAPGHVEGLAGHRSRAAELRPHRDDAQAVGKRGDRVLLPEQILHDLHAQWPGQQALNRAAQRTGTVVQVGALLDQEFLRAVGQCERQAALVQPLEQ